MIEKSCYNLNRITKGKLIMIGYKATYNMKCETLTYEIGKIYSIDNMEMCSHGFHFCQNAEDTLNYYTYNKDFMLLEVEAIGKVDTKYDKSVTDKIKILRVIPKEEYNSIFDNYKIDENNNCIYEKNSSGLEEWKKYDENNNLIGYKNSSGYEFCNKYDKNNNLINNKDSSGYEEWNEYDKNNNLINKKNSSGNEECKEYDENNNLINYKDSKGLEIWYKYDKNNNVINKKDSNGLEYWNKYDENNNLINYKTSNGYEWKITIE
jgi:YD repeat-containing protein